MMPGCEAKAATAAPTAHPTEQAATHASQKPHPAARGPSAVLGSSMIPPFAIDPQQESQVLTTSTSSMFIEVDFVNIFGHLDV
jgi:hypothetical protein